MAKNKLSQCYLCGKIGTNFTIEHVPPKFLSPKSPDSEFAKVSACKECNNKYAHEESKFRDFLATATAHKGNKSADEAYQAARRNFQRNPAARLFIGPSKDLKRIVQNLKRQEIYTPGGIYLGTASILTPDENLKWKDILIKIAKGLHFLKTGAVIPETYKEGAMLIKEIEYPELFEQCNIKGHAGDFLDFRGGYAKEDVKSGLWYLYFYKQVGAMVWFLDPKAKSKSKVKI